LKASRVGRIGPVSGGRRGKFREEECLIAESLQSDEGGEGKSEKRGKYERGVINTFDKKCARKEITWGKLCGGKTAHT